jgi:hypothetical protein
MPSEQKKGASAYPKWSHPPMRPMDVNPMMGAVANGLRSSDSTTG